MQSLHFADYDDRSHPEMGGASDTNSFAYIG